MGRKKRTKNGRAAQDTKVSYKKEALTAAKDLCYGYEVMDRIRAAKTDNEIRRIMTEARCNKNKEKNYENHKRKL